MDISQYINQTKELIEHGRHNYHCFCHSPEDLVPTGRMMSFRAGGLALIQKLYGKNHSFYEEFNKITKGSSGFNMDGGVGVLNVVLEDIKTGGQLFISEERANMVKIFISHSSKDIKLAGHLIELFRNAMKLSSEDIRCTSVDGYRLPIGTKTDEQLKHEISSCEVLIGLISVDAVDSFYVIFELGARWGADKPLFPLLAPGVSTELLKGPLSAINALRCDNSSQLHQLIGDISKILNIIPDKPSAYQKYIDIIIAMPPSKKIEVLEDKQVSLCQDMTDIQKNIMKTIGKKGDTKVTGLEISAILKITGLEAKYNLDELDRKYKLLDWYGDMVTGISYYKLTHEGRAYILKQK